MFTIRPRASFAQRLVEFADQADETTEIVIPEDLSTLSDEDLATLSEQAVGSFDALYGDGSGLTADDLTALAALTEGIETLNEETAKREEAAASRKADADALAARVRPESEDENSADTDDPDAPKDEEEDDPADSDKDEPAAETVTASGSPRERRIQMRRRHTPKRTDEQSANPTMRDLVLSTAKGSSGTGLDWSALGTTLDRSLRTYQHAAYTAAARSGRHMKEQHSIASFSRPIPDDLKINSSDPRHSDEVFQRAMDETRLPGGNLTASGGWCAPSETLYDLCELESTDGLLSLPEIGVPRGGVNTTTGPSFADLYSQITGFHYTEEQDEAGTYGTDDEGMGDGTDGPKPCYKIDCPPFTETRLDIDGICLTAGLLQARGFPEYIARVTRGAMVAHEHRMSARQIADIAARSTAITMPADQAGAAAPILSAIELQAEHYRYAQRMSRNSTLEAVFPYWVRGAIRQDLSVRLGVDLIDVSDARIDGWFRSRGIAPQFVYDWQNVDATAAASFTQWPTTVDFLLYAAGTWVRGVQDIISLDTIYDSTLLGTNDYTALFTEDGYLLAQRCADSRVVTVSICPDGATHGGLDLGCDLTVAAAA